MNEQKCLIIHSPRLFYKNHNVCSDMNYAAMGLFSLASELTKAGFDTKILHLGVEKYLNKNFSISEYIKQNNIKFIALSLNWYPQSYDVIETARKIKEKCPDTYISLGGYTAGFFAKEILEKFPFINSIIKGEGEYPIVELAKRIYSGGTEENIPNITYRNNDKIISMPNNFVASDGDLNNYEFFNPDLMLHYEEYSKIPYILEYSKENQLNSPATGQGICLGRGCLGNCAWCGGGFVTNKLLSGRSSISYRSAENIMNEIKIMKEKYNIEYFRFSFDPDPTNRGYMVDLFNKIADEFNGTINAIYNIDGLPDKEFLDAYKRAFSDNSTLMLSPVFFDEELRKKYKSFYYSNAELEEILEYMDKLDIKSEIYFSIFPGINNSDNKESEKYGKFLKANYKCVKEYYMYNIDIEPGSPWTYHSEKYNIKNPRKTFIEYYNNAKGIEESFESSRFNKELCLF